MELICDGLHIHPAVIRATHKLFGDKLVIISDSLRCAGMPDGEYELGGQPIEMKGGKATLRGTDTLAGSSSNLLSELQNVVAFGLPLEDAVTALTLAPARAVRWTTRSAPWPWASRPTWCCSTQTSPWTPSMWTGKRSAEFRRRNPP